MLADKYLKHYLYEGVIEEYAKRTKVDLRIAFDIFYRSNISKEIHNGVSDMHCRSDGYLAEELIIEQELKSLLPQ